jgi:3-methyl-2-oxobutanoate hydroxymethyltransferase
MVVLGYSTTQPVTMDDMIHHCKAVRRGAPTRFIVGDMPFGSYEVGTDQALKNALRFVKEAGVDAVKIEGGQSRAETVRKLVDSGIAVMGHVGLTPQGIGVLGGFRAQGRTAVKARKILDDALALQDAGAFALVIECVPSQVAKAVTEALKIPVIGIGAGPYTTGQVLVYHDLLGVTNHPHHEKYVPSFCKRYAQLGHEIHEALTRYYTEVHQGIFPSEEYNPYKMSPEELKKFDEFLGSDQTERSESATRTEKKLVEADEYEVTKLY